jgi:hypothetical protein
MDRTFEATALSHLLEWASTSIEGSVNQPALPHAIIVLNAADHNLPDWAWDVEQSTKKLLSALDPTIRTNAALSRYISYLNKNGRVINCTQDLVRCYYSSIRVVRIPAKGKKPPPDPSYRKKHPKAIKDVTCR